MPNSQYCINKTAPVSVHDSTTPNLKPIYNTDSLPVVKVQEDKARAPSSVSAFGLPAGAII